jgi:hypothetical protein
MICPKCGSTAAVERKHCSNCGTRRVRALGPEDLTLLQAFVGCCCGIGLTALLYASAFFLAMVHPPPNNGSYEFAPSKGQSVLWAIETVGLLVGIAYVLFAPRLVDRPRLRSFLLGLGFVTLGGMLLCEAVSLPILFDNRF